MCKSTNNFTGEHELSMGNMMGMPMKKKCGCEDCRKEHNFLDDNEQKSTSSSPNPTGNLIIQMPYEAEPAKEESTPSAPAKAQEEMKPEDFMQKHKSIIALAILAILLFAVVKTLIK